MAEIKLTTDEVRHLARLARIALTEAEIKRFQRQLTEVIDYNVQILERLDVSTITPTLHTGDEQNTWQEDIVSPSLSQSIVLAQAPLGEDGQFVVPKVFED